MSKNHLLLSCPDPQQSCVDCPEKEKCLGESTWFLWTFMAVFGFVSWWLL
jgi:hypothetical protein